MIRIWKVIIISEWSYWHWYWFFKTRVISGQKNLCGECRKNVAPRHGQPCQIYSKYKRNSTLPNLKYRRKIFKIQEKYIQNTSEIYLKYKRISSLANLFKIQANSQTSLHACCVISCSVIFHRHSSGCFQGVEKKKEN